MSLTRILSISINEKIKNKYIIEKLKTFLSSYFLIFNKLYASNKNLNPRDKLKAR